MKKIQISLPMARKMALHAQLLDGRINLPAGKEGALQAIQALGYVQIDPLSVIERAQHHILWTRLHGYQPEMLQALQNRDRKIFEYWGHALSYFPIADYRFCLPRMRNFGRVQSPWVRYMAEKSENMMEPVMKRIREEGPLGLKDFAPRPKSRGASRSSWQNISAIKASLEWLFWKGEIMVCERRNLDRIFDLTERVLPQDLDVRFPHDEEMGGFLVRRALSAQGLATAKEIQRFMQPDSTRDSHVQATQRSVVSASLNELVAAGEVIACELREEPNATYYSLAENVEKCLTLPNSAALVHIISPFDSLLTQRNRVRRLFGFDYALECYLPASKRKYGYFVLPILWQGQFIGRLDPKADRKVQTLLIRSLRFEPGFTAYEEVLPPLAQKLAGFAHFNRCQKIMLENLSPAKIKAPLVRFLKQAMQKNNP